MADKTIVLFRRWGKRNGGGVIAVFPQEKNHRRPGFCMMYEHEGQHGEGSRGMVMDATRPASEEEYAPLKAELESAPYCYDLDVRKRSPH